MLRWLVLLATGCGVPERGEGSFHTAVRHDGDAIACDMSSVTIVDRLGLGQNSIDVQNVICATTFKASFFHMFDNVVDLPCDSLRVVNSGCPFGGDLSGTARRDDAGVVAGTCTCAYEVVDPGRPTISHLIELDFRGPAEVD